MLRDRKGWWLDRCYRNLLAEMPSASCWEQVITFLFVLMEGALLVPRGPPTSLSLPFSSNKSNFVKKNGQNQDQIWSFRLGIHPCQLSEHVVNTSISVILPGIQVARSTYCQGDLPLTQTQLNSFQRRISCAHFQEPLLQKVLWG